MQNLKKLSLKMVLGLLCLLTLGGVGQAAERRVEPAAAAAAAALSVGGGVVNINEATAEQLESAREKAFRAPFLMLAIVRLQARSTEPARKASAGDGNYEALVCDAERLVSLGCAIQNIILAAHAAGFGSGLTSGQAMGSSHLRRLFSLGGDEQAVVGQRTAVVQVHLAAAAVDALGAFRNPLHRRHGLFGLLLRSRLFRGFARIENVLGVECGFDPRVKIPDFGRNGLFPPGFLGETDAVFPGDDAVEG